MIEVSPFEVLSRSQQDVAARVVKGLSNQEIAAELFITEKTVKFHLTNIYKALNVSSRAQLIVLYLKEAPPDDGELNTMAKIILGRN